MPKKHSIDSMTFEVEYSNGDVESIRTSANEAKNRFYDFVHSAVCLYLDGFREVRLLDCSGRVFRSYRQHF